MFSRDSSVATLIFLAVCGVAAGAIYFLFFFDNSGADIRKFTGNLVDVQRNTVFMKGVFYPLSGPVPEKFSAARNFAFRVSDETEFRREVLARPSMEEIMSQGGHYRPSSIPSEEGPGSLADMQRFMGSARIHIEASFPESIHNAFFTPTANHVIYRVLPRPSFSAELTP